MLASAHAKLVPMLTWVKVSPDSTPVAATGVFCAAVVVPLPSWPWFPAPQQSTAPALVSPHAKAAPTSIWVKVSPPDTSTGTLLFTLKPFPSWPLVPCTQHQAAPPLVNAHAKLLPTPIWVSVVPAGIPPVYTGTGTVLLMVELSPSVPVLLSPQQ